LILSLEKDYTVGERFKNRTQFSKIFLTKRVKMEEKKEETREEDGDELDKFIDDLDD